MTPVKAEAAVVVVQTQPHPNPDAQANVFRRFHPDLTMRVIPDAGHWAMYENPDAFNRTVLELLAQPLRQR